MAQEKLKTCDFNLAVLIESLLATSVAYLPINDREHFVGNRK